MSKISFFQKVLLFFFWNKPDKRELFLIRLLVKEFSFFSYSLRTTSSITAWARVMFSSLYTKTYKCLSNNINDVWRNEWEIKLKSVINFDRESNVVQNRLTIYFFSCPFIVEKFPFLSIHHEKMTFFRNKFLITQR